jgi:cytoskeletal protein RodZ
MADGSDGSSPSKTIFKFSWIVVLIVALTVVGIFYSRWQENRDIAERAAEQQREQASKVAEGLGGNNFEIMSFYASPGATHRGDSVAICYGVSNAKTVEIEPKLPEPTWPSPTRCISVEPKKTTTYTLTATNAAGQKKTSSLTIEVQ